uniref:DUF1421 domain-containing protein n=1 Tax=Angiostrongylus cantonensis TaxID=6313 RepID=A0A0K0DF80_ANGCA
MHGSRSNSSQDSRQSSSTHCDPDKPSTSYYIPPEDSYLDAPVEQPTFLKSSTYGQISYEVDVTNNTSFNYACTPRHTLESQKMPSLPKYLEDTSYSGHGMLDATPEYHLANAPASVPPNFSYLSDLQESDDLLNVQSPRDDARFSTPEYTPDSLPMSAAMSSEAYYIPSPTCASESSTITFSDSEQTAVIIGQNAKRASRKDAESIRYESPKNCDSNWSMKAFHLSSEEMDSADDVELTNSTHSDDDTQLETDESEGRVSIVDRLFAMLQREEKECSKLVADGFRDEASQKRNYQITETTPTNALADPSPCRFQQTQYTPQVAQFRTVAQDQNAQNIGMPHSSQLYNVPTEYVSDSFHTHTTENPAFLSSAAVPTLPQYPPRYPPQYPIHQYPQQHDHIPSMERNPIAPALYSQAPTYNVSSVPLQQQDPTHQYIQPVISETINQFPVRNYPAMPFFYPPNPWNISSYEQPAMFGPPQFVPQTLEQESLPYREPEENTNVEPVEYEEASRESFSTDWESETDNERETDVDVFDSISCRQSVDQEEINEFQEEPHLKGPPFEQKGPTQTKEIGPVPSPPPPSPENAGNRTHLEGMDRNSIIEQLRHEMDRLEDISLHDIADYDRQEELKELCEKMNSRFQRFYPHLNLRNDDDESDKNASDEGIIEDGDPEDGYVMRNSIQLTIKYLALWYPEKKEREQMIPWNIMRKVKPIRLCFLDNRIGHGEFENFNIGEFVSITGHMMFAYGDGPEALDETRLFVLDIEQNRIRHMLYRVMVDQGRYRGQHYIENRMGGNEKGATEVVFLRKMTPHIYNALKVSYEDQLEFLCEERRIQDCDPDLANIKMFLKHRNRHLSDEHKELLNYARRVSYCSRTGRLSAFRSHRFHEFLGFPDLQTDLIYVLDFIAREIVMEVTYHAAIVRQQERQAISTTNRGFLHQPTSKAKLAAESMELRHYEDALRKMIGWRKNEYLGIQTETVDGILKTTYTGDILFGDDEREIMLSYGKNPRKWESDNDYNKREATERREFEDLRPMPRRTVCFTSAELFEEHKKVLRGEYWDSCPEDLTKEAFVLANTYAAARRAQVTIPQPNIPQKWKEQKEKNIKENNERLDKLRTAKRESDQFNRLTEQLVQLMEKNTIHDSVRIQNDPGNDGSDLRSAMKAIHAAVRRHRNFSIG